MAVGIRCAVLGTNDGSSGTVSANTVNRFTGTQPQSGDRAILIYFNDYYALSNMGTPSGGPTWNTFTNNTADGGANNAHIKAYEGSVTSNADFTASATETGSADEEKGILVIVLSGVDATTTIDVAATATAGSSSAQDAPSVDPATSDGFAIWFVSSGTGAAAASYTSPGSVTELTEVHVGGLSGVCATEQLASGAATGTRTFTASTSTPYASISIVVRTASGSQNLSRTASDNAAATDSVTRTSTRPRAISDNAAATDSVTRTSTRSRTISDSAPATDNVTFVQGKLRTVSDSAPATDVAVRAPLLRTRTTSDSAPATDAVTRTSSRTRSISDTAPATDGVTRVRTSTRSVSDTAAATDSVTRTSSKSRTVADSAPATDTATGDVAGGSQNRTATDSAPATDVVVRQVITARSVVDSAPASDSVVQSSTRSRTAADIAAATDVVTRLLSLVRTPTDTAPLLDGVTVRIQLYKSVTDTAPATDVAAVVGQPAGWPAIVGVPYSTVYWGQGSPYSTEVFKVGQPYSS